MHWDVWEVKPTAAERRYLQRRVREDDRIDSSERRSGDERRRSKITRTIATEFASGWLCFECVNEKRRLAPVPEGWERVDDDTIEQWCCAAKPVVRRKPDSEFGGGAAKIR